MRNLNPFRILATLGVFLGALVLAIAPASASADPVPATFQGAEVDLADGWGKAGACAELGDTVECYASEVDLLDAHPDLAVDQTKAAGGGGYALLASCSSSLRLYSGTGYGGSVLYLTTRGIVHNLSSYGFDNTTSSYRVGACSSVFAAGANLGGNIYPGSTSAWSQASSMLGGWNNVVSSVYIY